jgi:Na+-transporting methylmalonyl-CoA/oxaloacetate decarboxylase gamma subunit
MVASHYNNEEQVMAGGIAFAGQAAGMGVAIVFAFLTVMSLLMVAMRSVDEFAGKTASRSKSDGVPVQTPAPTSPTPSPGKRIPEWAIAAAVV